MSRSERRTRGKRSRRKAARTKVERCCELYVAGHSANTISRATGLPTALVVSILESVESHLARARASSPGGGY